ncbi:serum response factor homolog [Daktulosphaira vitifoliae]|uniref:serum response factor homolog n=1 Tax=Daktulosphaira vitifoliae TaxID=58002 RepID=UPI0021AB03EB|nr:serum response factor homolog [Daktulosphaira vitifoliae]
MRWTAMDSASGGGGRDNRFGMGYASNMSLLDPSDIYNNGGGTQQRPSTSRTPPMMGCGSGNTTGVHQRGIKRTLGPGSNMCYDPNDHHRLVEDFSPPTAKDVSPSNGKKTKGRVKIKMEYIENKLRRYTTFSKRKTGIMKKAYELSTLTGTQVMLLVASETGHVYTFATRKLQPMITSEAGKALIQTCLNSPDPCPSSSGANSGDQRMSATGFEETDLSYNIGDDHDSKETDGMSSRASDSGAESSGSESPPPVVVSDARSPPSSSAAVAKGASAATSSPGIFRLSSSNAELVYSNLAAMVNSSEAGSQQAAVLYRLGQLGRQLQQASGQQQFMLSMSNPPAAHQTPADLSNKSSRNKPSEIQNP